MSVSTYAYVNARIGGMKSYLLKEEDFKALIEARDLEEIAAHLKTTRYAEHISEPNVLSLELQLKRSLYKDYLKLINCVEGSPREFIHQMAKRFEVEALKSMLKMKALKIALDEYIIPFGQVDEALIERLRRTEDLPGLIQELKGTDYYEPLADTQKALKEKGERPLDGEELPYLNALDTYYFSGLTEAMKRLSRQDRAMVARFVGFNIDLSNLLMALRLRGLEGELTGYFVEGGDSFNAKHFNIVTRLENLSRLPEVVPRRLVECVSEALESYREEKSLLHFEIAAKRQLLKESRRLFLTERFHIGTIIAYLNLKENEISNLIKIIKTKDELFSARDIEPLLILV